MVKGAAVLASPSCTMGVSSMESSPNKRKTTQTVELTSFSAETVGGFGGLGRPSEVENTVLKLLDAAG